MGLRCLESVVLWCDLMKPFSYWDNKEPETPPNFEESSTNSQLCLCSSTTHLNKYARQLANLPQMQGVTKKTSENIPALRILQLLNQTILFIIYQPCSKSLLRFSFMLLYIVWTLPETTGNAQKKGENKKPLPAKGVGRCWWIFSLNLRDLFSQRSNIHSFKLFPCFVRNLF